MANRSLWPESIEIHQNHLEYDTNSRVSVDDTHATYFTSRGVVSGLVVSLNGATLVNISAGVAFAPNGEYASYAGTVALPMADYTATTQNYVLLMYDEVQSDPEAHEVDGSTRNTKQYGSPRAVVLTAAQYAALPSTSLILGSNARDRAIILAIVTANGVGVLITISSLPTVFNPALSISQPVNITGVQALVLSTNTPVGNGTLDFSFGAPLRIRWTAPGDGAGGWQIVTTSGALTLQSGTVAYTLQVDVTYPSLPSANASDTLVISSLYTQTVPRFSALDHHHRALLGSGIPSTKNPHGMTLSDIAAEAAGPLVEHQDLMHSNGIWEGSNAATLLGSVNIGGALDFVEFATGLSGGNIAYVNGKQQLTPAGGAQVLFADLPVGGPPALFGIYLDQNGALRRDALGSERAIYTNTMAAAFISLNTQIINVSDDIGAIAGVLKWYTGTNDLCLSVGGVDGPRVGQPVTAYPVGSAGNTIRLYAPNHVSYIDVFVRLGVVVGIDRTENITFRSMLDTDENMLLCYIYSTGNVLGVLWLGYGCNGADVPNAVYDRRLFGNLGLADLRTDTRFNPVAIETTELLAPNGVYIRDVDDGTAAASEDWQVSISGLNILVNGGVCYVAGKRFEVPSATFNGVGALANTYIWVDETGAIQQNGTGYPDLLSPNINIVKLWRLWWNPGVAEYAYMREDGRFVIGETVSKSFVYVSNRDSLVAVGLIGAPGSISHFRSLLAAVNHINNRGGPRHIVLSPGTHYVGATITIPTGTILEGENYGSTEPSVIELDTAVTSVVAILGTNVYCRNVKFGHGTGTSTYALQVDSKCVLEQCVIGDAHAAQHGTYVPTTVSDVTFNSCEFNLVNNRYCIHNNSGVAATISNISLNNCRISANTAIVYIGANTTALGLYVRSCTGHPTTTQFGSVVGIVNDCVVDGCYFGGMFTISGSVANMRITNNTFGDTYLVISAWYIIATVGAAYSILNLLIRGNIIYYNAGMLASALDFISTVNPVSKITITDNIIYGVAKPAVRFATVTLADLIICDNKMMTSATVRVECGWNSGTAVTISNNSFTNVMVVGNDRSIMIDSFAGPGAGEVADHTTITNNTIVASGAGGGRGIHLKGKVAVPIRYALVSDNSILWAGVGVGEGVYLEDLCSDTSSIRNNLINGCPPPANAPINAFGNTTVPNLGCDSILTWGAASINAGGIVYLCPGYDTGAAPTIPPQYRMPVAGYISAIRVDVGTTPNVATAIIVTNGTSLNAINIPLAAPLVQVEDLGSTLHFNAGELVYVIATQDAGCATVVVSCKFTSLV